MRDLRTSTASGHITVVQEQRFRLLTDSGQGMLFTLARDAPIGDADLRHFRDTLTRVVVQYSGEPNLASAAAHIVRSAASPAGHTSDPRFGDRP